MGKLLDCFDKLMDGGLKHNTVYLVCGLPGSGKSSLAMTLSKEFLEQGKKVAFLSTNVPKNYFMKQVPNGLRGVFEEHDGKHFRLCSTGQEDGCIDITDLNELARSLQGILKEGFNVLVFDSMSSLFLFNDQKQATKFLQLLGTKARESDVSVFGLLEEGVHDQTVVNTLAFLVDGVFKIRMKAMDGSEERQFKIETLRTAMHYKEWLPIHVDDGGFMFDRVPEDGWKK